MKKHSLQITERNKIILTEFPSGEKNAPIILIASATGVKQTYYYKFAAYFSEHNYHVYTFDYEGIGESKTGSLKGLAVNASDWAEKDLNAVIEFIKQKHPVNKLIAIGHSIGGQLIGLAPSNTLIDEVVLIAAQTGYWKLWPAGNKIRMFLTWYLLVPVLTKMFGYFPGKKIGISEDLPRNVALEWASWCKSPSYLFAYKKNASDTFNNIKVNIISYSFSDDSYAPKKAVDWLTNQYTKASVTRIHIHPADLRINKVGHFGFFKSKNKNNFWEELKARI